MKTSYLILFFFCSLPLFAEEGKEWTPKILDPKSGIFLPNYSFSGYRWGEKELPQKKPTLSVEKFGAKPDDGKDDTKAVLTALKHAMAQKGPVVLHFPPGRFLLSDILYIERSHFVIQGSGSGKGGTVLAFTRSLNDMNLPESFLKRRESLIKNKKYVKGKLFSLFSWSGGVIWTRLGGGSKYKGSKIDGISGVRGNHEIQLEKPGSWKPNDTLDLRWYNTQGKESSFLKHVFGPDIKSYGVRLTDNATRALVQQPVTVVSVKGKTLIIKEPLLHDLRPEWNNTLQQVLHLEEVGFEGFRVEFPDVPYAGHHLEEGYNGLSLTQLKHSWVKDVVINNTDAGILTSGSKNLTYQNIAVTGRTGHYSVHIGGSYGVLCKDFRFESSAVHDPSFNSKATLCVYSHGKVRHAKLDQHNGINHQNLFENLDIENGKDLFRHGGAGYWAPTAGQFNTFWNIRMKKTGKVSCRNAPSARLIGLISETPGLKLDYHPKPYVEGLNQKGISVPSLYEYQLDVRLSSSKSK